MLTKADEYPFHQTPEPMAYAGTDRNFYDRYFFNGMSRDGDVFFAVAFGVYPNLGIMDAAFNVSIGAKQRVLRASRHMGGERADLQVGPIRIEILEPLERVRIVVEPNDSGLRADLVFSARHAPIEEPRFMRRIGTRAFMDYTRMTQNVSWDGWFDVDGLRFGVAPATHWGTRDRSWGVRPVGAPDPQPPADAPMQFFWLWTPANFNRHVAFCHTNDDGDGRPWNRRAVVQEIGAAAREFETVRFEHDWAPGTRRLAGLTCRLEGEGGQAELRFTPRRRFSMAGLGYGHPEWRHGADRGPLAVAHEVIDLGDDVWAHPVWLHIQAIAAAELRLDGEVHTGIGVVEQLFLGPNRAAGLTGLLDPVD